VNGLCVHGAWWALLGGSADPPLGRWGLGRAMFEIRECHDSDCGLTTIGGVREPLAVTRSARGRECVPAVLHQCFWAAFHLHP